ncbi:hypothetical protein CHS0354_032598 [Potamilus streckersoni]|uniref:Polypeptide N-acetylgalactosaminyltransferase n=1 Tax=Potamilus streckersoni TaxID=2493646 RepID=A0AAE0T8B8_9BIVA|nr:hypothetical protein CHS0354_032598 [Potamilus streckersoni]
MRIIIRYVITAFTLFCLLIILEVVYYSREAFHFNNGYYYCKSYNMSRNFSELMHDEQQTLPEQVSNLKKPFIRRHIARSWKEYQNDSNSTIGNPLIDDYGQNDPSKIGEYGRGVTFVGEEKIKAQKSIEYYQVNLYASDLIPLNRMVPDSRFINCKKIKYPKGLPTASVIIPFYDEWPSLLLRTVYSVVNRTPRHLLEEIILVDDGSTLEELKEGLDDYIKKYFPDGLIKLLRLPQISGLIKARTEGWKISTGKVLVFFDSHMEVNMDWLQPLLAAINKERTTVAMGILDSIQRDSFQYDYYDGYVIRYGFEWRLGFFETYFRADQIGKTTEDVRLGTVMVGAAYAIDSSYFREIRAYDEGMKVWGGENLEMSWRVILCGGRLIHVPCSHFGHVDRFQPYSFPGGRRAIEMYNYKRAIEVWMEPDHKMFVYHHYPEMNDLDVGNLSERLEIKKRLECKPFSYFLANHWPELLVYNQNVYAWGFARNPQTNKCLDNHYYLYRAAEKLYAEHCSYQFEAQGFSWMTNKQLRTTLQCVVVKTTSDGERPMLEDCFDGPFETWEHKKSGYIKHEKTGLCLDIDISGPVMRKCTQDALKQSWEFTNYLKLP